MTGYVYAAAMALLDVNGPEGVPAQPEPAVPEWDAIVWRPHERYVGRMRQKIFAAAQAGDLPRVRNLQELLLGSWSNTLVSVRLVTQRNAGCFTAGIDGEVVRIAAQHEPAQPLPAQLRHAHATELINAGVSIEVVRRRLGHASTENTQLYTLLADEVADAEIRAARRRRDRR